MTVYVRVKINEDKLKWPSEDYIYEYEKYNLECKIQKNDLGIIFTKYEVELTGEKNNIELYLGYLQRKGFKIMQLPSRFSIV